MNDPEETPSLSCKHGIIAVELFHVLKNTKSTLVPISVKSNATEN